jgi:hypothetical protein
MNIGEDQNVEGEPVERWMTVIIQVIGPVCSNTISNTEHPNITEEEPDKEKNGHHTLHTTSERDRAEHQFVNRSFASN